MFMDKLGGGRLAGDILALLSALTFSLTFIFMRMQKGGSSLESMLLAHGLTAVIGLTVSLFLPAPHLSAKALISVAILGIFQVGLAAVLFAYALKHISAVTANLIAVIEPVFNPIWVFLVLGEAPGRAIDRGRTRHHRRGHRGLGDQRPEAIFNAYLRIGSPRTIRGLTWVAPAALRVTL